MTPQEIKEKTNLGSCLGMTENTDSTIIATSMNNAFENTSNQQTSELSRRQKLMNLQKHHGSGLWVQCDDCKRWRHLPNVVDTYELPKKWMCAMNPDKTMADCKIPEVPISVKEEEELIYSEYSAGSLVWARLPGWPWWPAMVDDCPDTEQFFWLDGFSDIPTHYNVVFFDASEVTRAWVAPEQLKPYKTNKNNFRFCVQNERYKIRLEVATKQADDAEKLTIPNRLAKYSFIARYKGEISSPKSVNKNYLTKYKKQLKRKYNVEILSDDSLTETGQENPNKKNRYNSGIKNNIIVVGKKSKAARSEIPKDIKEYDIKISDIAKKIEESLSDNFEYSEEENN